MSESVIESLDDARQCFPAADWRRYTLRLMKYEPIPKLSKSEIVSAIITNDPVELSIAVLAAALYSNDPTWAEGVCLQLARHEHENVRGNAVLGFGHIARIHGELSEEAVRPVIEAALLDSSDYVRGQADSAADDIEHFLKWKVRRQERAP